MTVCQYETLQDLKFGLYFCHGVGGGEVTLPGIAIFRFFTLA